MTLRFFCTALAHDLSHPLASVMNGTDAALRLSDGATGDALPALREILEDINNDNQRAGVVFERIINIVRSGSVQIVPTDPVELLGQVEGMVASRVAKAGVRLECSSSGRLPMLAADPVLVLMMILNLIDNAVTALSWDDVKNQSQHADLTDPRMGGRFRCARRTPRLSASQSAIMVPDWAITLQTSFWSFFLPHLPPELVSVFRSLSRWPSSREALWKQKKMCHKDWLSL